MITPIRYHSKAAIFVCGLLFSLGSSTACADHVDPAPLGDEIVQKLVRDPLANRDPLPQSLSARLDEASALIQEVEQQNSRPDSEAEQRDSALASKDMLLVSKNAELETLRSEARARFASKRTELLSLGLSDKVKSWDDLAAQVEDRFNRIEQALDDLRSASNKHDRSKALAHAKSEMMTLHDNVKTQTDSVGNEPIQVWHNDKPQPQSTLPISDKLPQYLSYKTPRDNMYAFLGNTLLPAAPATPANASTTCGYTSADVSNDTTNIDTQDTTITPEIQTLATSLNYSPVKIFQYVSQNIKFEPYYGSLKGAMGTLYAQSGGSTDQASLLIALLRASNIPARYVKGIIEVDDATPDALGGRVARWVGAKSYVGAGSILGNGQNPYVTILSNGIRVAHVWVEACVPYSHYRGAQGDTAGSRWIPLDPSFKDATYQPGIAIFNPTNPTTFAGFNYNDYLSKRSNVLLTEYYDDQVENYIKYLTPNFANNTLADVPYKGTQVPLVVDVLPASLPYGVYQFVSWTASSSSPETADLPDGHRYKFKITVNDISGTPLWASTPLTLSMPQIALSRVILSFQGATPYEQSKLATWQQDGSLSSAMPIINVVPVISLDGGPNLKTGTFTGTPPSVGLSTLNNKLIMTVSVAELPNPILNSATYENIGASNYHALEAYALQASDRLLTERAAKLLASVHATSNPNTNLDETEGAFLHLVGLKYLRYASDAAKHIGQLNGVSGESGNHLGLVSSTMKVNYLFDLPFAINRTGFLVDMKGMKFRTVDLTTGKFDWNTYLLAGYSASALESYVWQENARTDAVSTVRGLQYANETRIPVLTINSGNWITQSPLLLNNADPTLNYSPDTILTLLMAVQTDTLHIPRSLIRYGNWLGSVWEQENNDPANHYASTGFVISGGYSSGGYTVFDPISINNSYSTSPSAIISGSITDQTTPSSLLNSFVNSPLSSTTGANGINQLTVTVGDPVNMATGNLYHTERDISIKGRGGLPIVFDRSYNSRNPQPGPLGYGWTHSFNHFLKFYGVDTDGKVKASWIDGTGGEKFFAATPVSGGIAPGTTMTNAPGIFVVFQRQANGTYTVTEKNGLIYTFASNAGATAGQSAQLLSIVDRNGNTLTLNYTGNNLASVTDSIGRTVLSFSYNASNQITQITDLAGRIYQYGYTDANSNLNSFKNPLAVASSSQPPVTYQYYSAADGTNLNHAMKNYALPRGNGMTFEYYTNGKMFRHTDPQGHTNTFTYNDFRRETVQVNERGQTRRFFFDQYGNPSQIVEETGATHSYTYDSTNVHNRLTETSPQGYVTSYIYDSMGNVTQITRPSGNTVAYSSFTSYNQPGKIKDANGNTTLLKYDSHGNLLQEIQLKQSACATLSCATLNPNTYQPAATDMIAWTVNAYDVYGNLTSSKRVRDFAGQVANNTAISNTGPIISNGFDTSNLYPISISRTGNMNGTISTQSATLVFDTLGRLKNGIDADWQMIQFNYDSVDRINQGTDATGNLRTYSYDLNGNPQGQTLKSGGALVDSSYTSYDSNDRKAAAEDSGGNITAYQYDEAGNVVQITSPDNYTLGFQYDAVNHVVKAYDQKNHVVSRTLDLEGKTRTVTDPNGNTVVYSYYDGIGDGRLKSITDAANHSTSFSYDANGNATSVTDNLSRVTLSQYDELNRPVRIVGPLYVDASLGNIRPVTRYGYDNLGNRTNILAGYTTDSSGANPTLDVLTVQTSSYYDDFARKLTENDALNQTRSFSYDANNNDIRATDAKGQVTQYTWYYGHLLKSVTDNLNNVTSYTRNALGQPITAQSPSAVRYTYGYDASHRLASVNDSRGNKTLSYTWSPGGLLNNMKDSDGNVTNYLYDAVGRLAGIWVPNGDNINFTYDAGGRLVEKLLSNGVDSQFTWNADNTLASLTNKAGSNIISSHVYTYDGVGNRSSQLETVNGTAISYSYAYDNLNRLIQVQNGNAATQENYSYDSLGNRLTKQVNVSTPSVIAYVYDAANQLKEIHQTSATGPLLASLAYDANGSMTGRSDTGLALTYDALNRVTQATLSGQVSSYAYDDQGRRIQKTVAGIASNFLYSGPDIVAEYTASWGLPVAQYTHGPNTDEPIERITSTAAQYFHHDGLGSIVGVTNNTGGTDATQRFDAWGNKVASTGTAPRYGYTGREPDETGIVYYRARYYDSSVGRFTQRDPIGLQGGINQYLYVNGNPVNFNDPNGLLAAGPSGSNASVYQTVNDQPVQLAFCAICAATTTVTDVSAGGAIGGGYQGLNSAKKPADGGDPLFGTQTGTPPSSTGGAWQGLKDAINKPGEFINWATGGLILNEGKSNGNPQSGLGEQKPNDAPSGTLGLDQAGRKLGWDKDTTHGIKDAATGGMAGGRTWVGVAPDGTVGINEGGRWSPQGHYNGLKP